MCVLELLLCKLVIYVQELNACNPAHGCALGVALCYCGYLCILIVLVRTMLTTDLASMCNVEGCPTRFRLFCHWKAKETCYVQGKIVMKVCNT